MAIDIVCTSKHAIAMNTRVVKIQSKYTGARENNEPTDGELICDL